MNTDWFTNILFNRHRQFIYPYSRFYCDVERLPHEIVNGIICTKDNNGIVYREPDEAETSSILAEYKAWLLSLKKEAEYLSSYYANVVVVDCHSFRSNQVNMTEDEVPDICIGFNDDNALPKANMQHIADLYQSAGYSVKFNFPYANAIKGSDLPNVFSIMLEVNKRLYVTDTEVPKLIDLKWLKLKATNDLVFDYLQAFEMSDC